uniref:ABC transporter domain-containing protein n=1 Tax=Parascaris equorum TaxID=6256 RepID=A0A914RF81_PAREQ
LQNLDGHAVKRIPLAELRQQIALVGQEPVLFSGTIRENILLGVENKSDDDVVDACEMANARHFIEAMPQDLLTSGTAWVIHFLNGSNCFLYDAAFAILIPTS